MFSIITTCKGRLSHLRRSLPAMLYQFNSKMQFRTDYEVIVVDYGCPENTFSEVIKIHNSLTPKFPNLKILKVKDKTDEWNPGRARNIGANQATWDYLFFIDADMILQPLALKSVEDIIKKQKNPVCIQRNIYNKDGDKNGTCIIHAQEFHMVNGYNEAGIGWCLEDIELYNRLYKFKRTYHYKDEEIKITPIHHGWDLRSKYNKIKDRSENLSTYYQKMCQHNNVNPNGYGQGKLIIYPSKN